MSTYHLSDLFVDICSEEASIEREVFDELEESVTLDVLLSNVRQWFGEVENNAALFELFQDESLDFISRNSCDSQSK